MWAQFSQLLCHCIARMAFLMILNDTFAISIWNFVRMVFTTLFPSAFCLGWLRCSLRRLRLSLQLSSFFFFFICSEFYHTLKWYSHGFTCVPQPDSPSHLPLHPLPLGLPSAPGPSACLMHPTWAGYLFHPRQYTCFDAVLLKHPTLAFSHRVQNTVL